MLVFNLVQYYIITCIWGRCYSLMGQNVILVSLREIKYWQLLNSSFGDFIVFGDKLGRSISISMGCVKPYFFNQEFFFLQCQIFLQCQKDRWWYHWDIDDVIG